MIKVNLKNGGLAEKPKVIIDNHIVGNVSSGKTLTLNLDNRKAYFITGRNEWKKSTNRNKFHRQYR